MYLSQTNCTKNIENNKNIHIRVGVIQNPKLTLIEETQINQILKELAEGVDRRFNKKIVFSNIKKEGLQSFFNRYQPKIDNLNGLKRYMFNPKKDDKNTFYNQMVEEMNQKSTKKIKKILNGQGYSLNKFGNERSEIIKNIVNEFIKKFNAISQITFKSGQRLLDEENMYNEFLVWNGIGEIQTDYDLIITNQIIVSLESYYPSVQIALNGGINSGLSIRSRTPLNGVVILSTFPFMSNEPYFKQVRGYQADKIKSAKYIAWTGVKQFGRILTFRSNHYNHPPGCVMSPVQGLNFKKWYDKVSNNKKCNEIHQPVLKSYFLNE